MRDTKGRYISTDDSRYVVRTQPELVAGYVGLPSTAALKELYSSKAWKTIADHYVAGKRKFKWSIGSIEQVFYLVKHRTATEKYGEDGAPKPRWTAKDHTAHAIQKILKAKDNFVGKPTLGPLANENPIEAWNRAWSLLENYQWLITKDKASKKFFGSYNHTKAKKPAFMLHKSDTTEAPRTEYHPYQFLVRWMNRSIVEGRFPTRAGEFINIPDLIRVADPRITPERPFRDHVRRTLSLKSFNLDIQTMVLITPVKRYVTSTDWDEIQQACQQGTRDADFSGFEFQLYTKEVAPGVDIFESLITDGLDEIYAQSTDGKLARNDKAETASNADFDDAEPDQQPDDFFAPEDRMVNDFDPWDDSHNPQRRKYQLIKLRKLRKGVIEVSRSTDDATEEDTAVHEQAARFTDMCAMDSDVLNETADERARLAKVRGGETFIGPDYKESCKMFGLDSTNPKIPHTNAKMKPHQVTMLNWCLAQAHGTWDAKKIWTRLPVRCGMICDEMGTGKTHGMLGYICIAALASKKFMKATLWLTSPSLLYQTFDVILRDFPLLKPYIYHGTSAPPDDDYAGYRILPRDISEYNGSGTLNEVKPELQYILDGESPDARKAIILSPTNSFRDRSGILNPDRENVTSEDSAKEVEWLCQFVRVFSHVVVDEGHCLKNPDTKLFKVVKALEAEYLWVLTGTPMANSARDFAGLLTLLYRPKWEDALNASQKVLWDKNNLNVFAENATIEMQRLQMHPKFLQRAIFQKDNVKIAKYARAAMNQVYIRRTHGSDIPNGTSTPLRVGTSMPPLKITTVAVAHPPHQAAEFQLHHRYFAQVFENRIRSSVKRTDEGKNKFNYPSDVYRRLCLLTFSLAMERVSYVLDRQGISTSAENVLRWRSADPPIDFRAWADMARLPKDALLEHRDDYLQLLVDLSPKLKWLCGYVENFTVTRKEKTMLFYRWQPIGQLCSDFFDALGFRTATLHAHMSHLERHKVLKRFNDPEDHTIELLFVSYRISCQGLNAQGNCHMMVLLEPGLSRNEELQAIGRIHRELQLEACFVFRLYMVNSMDKYREFKSTEKFIPEIAVHSDGVECSKHLQELMEKNFPDEVYDATNNESVAKAAKLMVDRMFGQEAVAHEDGSNIHLVYDQIKLAHNELQ